MKASELRERFLKFFEKRGHKIIPSSPLIPQKDHQLEGTDEVLFVSAGMQPLIPYLTGKKEPPAKKLVSSQKCLRTDDIEEVGDLVHHTFFEMLGNWSIGNAYWKKEAIEMSLEFLTTELGIPVEKLAVSVFAGDKDAPKDEESAKIWKGLGIPKERVFYLGKEHNWWPTGKGEQDSGEFKGPFGPCGPDTEMFVWTGEGDPKGSPDKTSDWVEVWNDVFMEFSRKEDGSLEDLPQKNIDTGMGLERTLAVLNGKKSAYETDLFEPIISEIKKSKNNYSETEQRIIADHLKAATFLIAAKVRPNSRDDRGSVLRKLITEAVSANGRELLERSVADKIIGAVILIYQEQYEELRKMSSIIYQQLHNAVGSVYQIIEGPHVQKLPGGFKQDLIDLGTSRGSVASGATGYNYHQSYGVPGTVSQSIFENLKTSENIDIDLPKYKEGYDDAFKEHQDASKKNKGEKFAGGLADTSEKTVRGHTATHLLHQALRDVLGSGVHQTGSNITPERIRFDFSYGKKMTPDQIKKVEEIVNKKVKEDLKVKKSLTTQEEANEKGVIGLFPEKYEDKVSIYQIGKYSTEYCGGPHVEHTSKIGKFKIVKEESVGAGNRRIKAVLE